MIRGVLLSRDENIRIKKLDGLALIALVVISTTRLPVN